MPSIPTIATFVPGEAMPLTVMPLRTIVGQAREADGMNVYVDPIGSDIAKLFATTNATGRSESRGTEQMMTALIWQFQDECFTLARKTVLRFQNGADPLKLADELEENIYRGDLFRKNKWLLQLNDLYSTGMTQTIDLHRFNGGTYNQMLNLVDYLKLPAQRDPSRNIHSYSHYTSHMVVMLAESIWEHMEFAQSRGISISSTQTRSRIDNSPFINWRRLETLTNTVTSTFIAACEKDEGAVALIWDAEANTLRVKATSIDTAKLTELRDLTLKLAGNIGDNSDPMTYVLETGFNEASFNIHIPSVGEITAIALDHARLYEQFAATCIDSARSHLEDTSVNGSDKYSKVLGYKNALVEKLDELQKDFALANSPHIKMALEYRYRRAIEILHGLSQMKLEDDLVRDIAVAILSRSTSDLPIVRKHQRRREHVQVSLLVGEVKLIDNITPEKAVQSIRTIIDAFQNIVAVIVAKASAEGTRGAVKFVRENIGRLQEMLAQFDIISASLRAKEMMSEELQFMTSMVRHEIIGRDLQTIYSLLDFDDDIGPEEEEMLKSSIECLSPYSQYLTFLTGHIFQRYSIQVAKGEVELVNDIPLTTVLTDEIDLQKAVTVLTNLVENGVKYRDQTKTKSMVRIGFDETKNEIIYEDNGIGMSAKFLKKLLESHGKVREKRDRTVKGTGTGWTLIKRMIAQLGWKITEIQTSPGEGLRMRIKI